MASARARTKPLLQEFVAAMHAKRPPLFLDTGALQALRTYFARAYEQGQTDMHRQSTIPAPDPDGDISGRYIIIHEGDSDDR